MMYLPFTSTIFGKRVMLFFLFFFLFLALNIQWMWWWKTLMSFSLLLLLCMYKKETVSSLWLSWNVEKNLKVKFHELYSYIIYLLFFFCSLLSTYLFSYHVWVACVSWIIVCTLSSKQQLHGGSLISRDLVRAPWAIMSFRCSCFLSSQHCHVGVFSLILRFFLRFFSPMTLCK